MDCGTPGLPVHHQLPELTQTHAHLVGDAIQTELGVVKNVSKVTKLVSGGSGLNQVYRFQTTPSNYEGNLKEVRLEGTLREGD